MSEGWSNRQHVKEKMAGKALGWGRVQYTISKGQRRGDSKKEGKGSPAGE